LKKGVILTVTIVISALMLSFIAFPLSATAQGPDSNHGKFQVVSAFGKIPGKDLIVHIWVVIPQGSDKNEIIREALGQQGARPFDHTEFSTSGLIWDQFKDESEDPTVVLNYNPANEGPIDGFTILTDTHPTWTAVIGSNFVFELSPDTTTRCPSLVKECPGDQTFDGFNDIGWVEIKNPHTLAVTWFGTTIDEADIAWSTNNRINWGGNFDVRTVLLHELGHVLGLGHSDVTESVMFASYQGLRHTLYPDDECGIQELYGTPCSSPLPPPSPPTPDTSTSLDITHGSQHGSDGKIGTYSNRDTVHIFVEVLDGTVGVAGIPIHVVVNAPKSTLSGDTTTDDNGVAHIHYKVKAGRDGTLEPYHISATANGGSLSCNHNDDACHADFTVNK